VLLNLLYVLAALFLVLLNAFFVATEFAIVKVRKTRIDEMVEQGVSRAAAAKQVISNLNAYLSACQFGITIASLGLGWIGEPAFAHLIEPLFAWMGPGKEVAIHSVALTLAFVLITMLHIVLGELAPKTLAIQRAEATALWVAWPIRAFNWMLYPLIWALNGLGNLTVRAFGLDPAEESDRAHSEEELRLVLGMSRRSGALSDSHAQLLINALDFPDQTVRQIMVPRGDIVWLDVGHDLQHIRMIARKSGHTRYPLCEGDLDSVIGVVNVKDVFLEARTEAEGGWIREVASEPVLVPETLQVGKLLELFQQKRRHLFVVLDEYGGTAGIVTLEDVVEELTGEIQDEFDREAPKVRRLPDGRVSVDAALPVDELESELGIGGEFEEEVDTLGGLVFTRLGRLPGTGDSVELGGRRVEVSRMRGRRIVRLIVHP
jgi:CBS domain containing-hemolysin-like protein